MNGLTLVQIMQHHDAIWDAAKRRMDAEFKELQEKECNERGPIPTEKFKDFLSYQHHQLNRVVVARKNALKAYAVRQSQRGL